MSARDEVTVVVASIDASGTIEASVRGFLDEVGPAGRLLVVDASRDGSIRRVEGIDPRLCIVSRPPGTLAPVLWRDGLVEARTSLVAFSTAQMVPRAGWLAAMSRGLEQGGAVGVGGPIAPGPGLSATDRALYLLRYANYLPPVPESAWFEPPGDNAVYRREAIEAVPEAWAEGFWEVDVHRRMRGRGDRLACAPSGVVEFRGGCRLASSVIHRLAHARRFGAGRTRGRSAASKLVRVAAAPAVPALLAARIVRNLRDRGEPLAPWIAAAPGLGVLLSAWSLGEAAGAALGPGRSEAA